MLRFEDCDTSSVGVTNVYAGIYGDVYNWITDTIEANTPHTTATPATTVPAVVWEETTDDLPDGLVFASSSLNRSGHQEKLIGGQAPIHPDKWKFMVHIGKSNNLDAHPAGKLVQSLCHGTIVGDRWILTDGDCCHDWSLGDPIPENTSAGLEIILKNYFLNRASFSHLLMRFCKGAKLGGI